MSHRRVHIHPTPAALAAFIDGSLPTTQARDITEHLLSHCGRCEEVLSEISLSLNKPDTNVLNEIIDRHHGSEADSTCTPSLCDELLAASPPKRPLLVANSRRYLHEALCYELIDRAWDLRFTDPHEMRNLAALADSLSAALLRDDSASKTRFDLKARTLGMLANANRVVGNYPAAEQLLAQASEAMSCGTGDPLEEAHYLLMVCNLFLSKGDQDSAGRVAQESSSLFLSVGETHWAGMALVTQATAALELEQIDKAASLYLDSLAMIDASRERTSFVAVRHNYAVVLHDLGRYQEALAELREVRALFQQEVDRTPLLRVRHLEGQIARAMGHLALAEKCLLEARNGFVAAGLGTAAAELSLELACLYADQRRYLEVRNIAEAVVPIFQSCELERDVIAALLLFREAAQQEQLSVAVISQILEFLQVCQADPSATLDSFLR